MVSDKFWKSVYVKDALVDKTLTVPLNGGLMANEVTLQH